MCGGKINCTKDVALMFYMNFATDSSSPLQHQWQWNDPESQQGSRQEIVERQTTRIQNAISGVLPEDWFMPVVVISKTKSKTGNSRYPGIVTWSAK